MFLVSRTQYKRRDETDLFYDFRLTYRSSFPVGTICNFHSEDFLMLNQRLNRYFILFLHGEPASPTGRNGNRPSHRFED